MKYRGVIFDFNGVLLDDAGFQIQAWQHMARDLRRREMSEEELAVHMHGRPNAYVLSYLAGRNIVGEELLTLIQAKESLYRDLYTGNPSGLRLSPGAPELLDSLVAHSIPRTIATSSEKTNLDFFVRHLGLERWFDIAKIVYDDGRRPGKPAPDMYLAAARNIRLPPKECIVVEDAISGVEAARAAGIGYIIGIGAPDVQARLVASDLVSAVIESLAQFPRERLAAAVEAG